MWYLVAFNILNGWFARLLFFVTIMTIIIRMFSLSDPAYIVGKVKPVKLKCEQAEQLVECLSLENCGVNLSSTDASEVCFEWLSKRSPDSTWCEVVEALVTVQGLGYLVSHLLPPSKLNCNSW